VSIRALADYLGHSDPGFTLRVYSHLMPTSDEKARAVVDGSLTAAAVESSLNDDPGTMRFVN
jgi:integrase